MNLAATHYCKKCFALWRQCDDGSWNLRSSKAGTCCDNAAMGDNIAPLVIGSMKTAPGQEEIEIREALQAGPTPGDWGTDSTPNDGEYGDGGPDSRSGFSSFVVIDAAGNAICDTLNSDVAEVEEWECEDGAGATDRRGEKNSDFIAACNPANITALLSHLSDLRAEVERLRLESEHNCRLFNFSKLGHEQAFSRCQQFGGLLRRSLAQLGEWQRKYGEHSPEWLPPAGDVRLAEDIDAALAATEKGGVDVE